MITNRRKEVRCEYCGIWIGAYKKGDPGDREFVEDKCRNHEKNCEENPGSPFYTGP